MAKCIVCVELEGADQPLYGELHRMLLNAGLKATIAGKTGAEYQLPAGAYCYDGPLELDGVRDSLDVVVGSLGVPYGLLVTQGKSLWTLAEVKGPPSDGTNQGQDRG